MMGTTGLSVTDLILSSSGWPQPGSLVSTTVTPSAVMNTALLPPPPFITYRFSLGFSTSTTLGAGAPWPAGCWIAATVRDSEPAAASTPSTNILLIDTSTEWHMI